MVDLRSGVKLRLESWDLLVLNFGLVSCAVVSAASTYWVIISPCSNWGLLDDIVMVCLNSEICFDYFLLFQVKSGIWRKRRFYLVGEFLVIFRDITKPSCMCCLRKKRILAGHDRWMIEK